MRRAVFLDRDGVLNRCVPRPHTDHGSPRSVDEFVLLPSVEKAVDVLKKLDLLVVVVTNQPEVSRGVLRKEDLEAIHRSLYASLPVDDIFVCLHDDEDGCACRKPKPGMLFSAAKKWGVDTDKSFMVGDRWRDMQAGLAAGCTAILIGPPDNEILCHYTVDGLYEAGIKIAALVNQDETDRRSCSPSIS